MYLYKQIFITNINEIPEDITEDKQEMYSCMFLQRLNYLNLYYFFYYEGTLICKIVEEGDANS